MDKDKVVFELRDEPEGVTAIMGSYTLPDGRKAAAMDRIHGKYFVSPLPGCGYWVKYPQYDQIADKAKILIIRNLTDLTETRP
jgi:hypothetical protein